MLMRFPSHRGESNLTLYFATIFDFRKSSFLTERAPRLQPFFSLPNINKTPNINEIMRTFMPFLIALIFTAIACEPMIEPPTPSPAPELSTVDDGFTLTHGRLAFDDHVSFEKTFERLSDETFDFKTWEDNLPGFTSMTTAFNQITLETQATISETQSIQGFENLLTMKRDDNGEISIGTQVDHPVLARLVNADGILQIGHTAYKFTYDQVISLPNATEAMISQLAKPDLSTLETQASFSDIKRLSVDESASRSAAFCTQVYKSNGKTFRIKGGLQVWRSRVVQSLIATVCHEVNISRTWWPASTSSLRLTAKGALVNGTNVQPFFFDSGAVSNASDITQVLGSCTTNCPFAAANVGTTNSGMCMDGQQRTCKAGL